MRERFTGDDGKRRLVEVMRRQSLVEGSYDAATALIEAGELVDVPQGEAAIEQGGSDNDLYFIVAGELAILVNGEMIARRGAEHHVGEMTLVNSKARRSATAVALEDSLLLRVPESGFVTVGEAHPWIWRNVACELADRLYERNQLVRRRNAKSRVFIGSSRESLRQATVLQEALASDVIEVRVWTDRVFGPSDFAIEALERVAEQGDFAILVLGPDDQILSRAQENRAPRDNVVLELGLFIGAYGHRRVFIVQPRGLDLKIPSDILGVTPAFYDQAEIEASIVAAAAEIARVILALGPR